MAIDPKYDEQAFKDFEHRGWGEVSGSYHSRIGKVTGQAASPLLDVVNLQAGSRLLDLACGTGTITNAGVERGANAIGLDFAGAMISEARKLHPGISFQEGDAEDLPFEDSDFDAVVCNFGIRHFPHPESAIAEAFRVLAPGGRYAFTEWVPPSTTQESFHRIVREAVQAFGDLNVSVPAPPPHDFSDAGTSSEFLLAAGFTEPGQTELPLLGVWSQPEELLETIYNSLVRTRGLLEAQTEAVREQIHQAIIERAKQFERNGQIEIPMPAVINSASKP